MDSDGGRTLVAATPTGYGRLYGTLVPGRAISLD